MKRQYLPHAMRWRADWPHFFVIEVMQAVVARAGEYADTFALRGYDSVRLASASEILAASPGETGFACFDHRLNKAAGVLGFELS